MNIAKMTAAAIIPALILATLLPVFSAQEDQNEIAKWTFIVYIAADNNLESAGIEDINEMELIGSTEQVNIVVQFDRWRTSDDADDETNGDWTDTRRFLIQKDSDRNIIGSEEVEILGEINMGDPQELIDFTIWSMDNYPAENYAVVLWDHGGAFWGVCWDETVPNQDGHDHLDIDEVEYALEKIYLHRGSEKIELLGFDACLMAQMAVLYQIKDFASTVCASGFSEPGDGWPYTEILGPLVSNPEMSEKELAQVIVDEYVKSYPQPADQVSTGISMAAFDMSKINDVALILDRFSEELGKESSLGVGLDYLFQIFWARNNAQSYDMVNLIQYDITGYPMYDVIDFTEELKDLISDAFPKNSDILTLCDEVKDVIENDFIIRSRADGLHPNARGLTMYFPNKEANQLELRQLPTEYDPRYDETDFARDHLWENFLHAYYGIEPIKDSHPVCTIIGPEFNKTYSRDEERGEIWGTAYDREEIKAVEISIDGSEWEELPKQTGQGEITWRYSINLQLLEPGRHEIQVRARDVIHTTEPVRTLITIEPDEEKKDDGFRITDRMVEIMVMILIGVLFAFGMILYKGRSE
ncbi:MAG: clostripain-related cysteine peptidase [Thermoplasmatota archaeon]